MATGTRMIHGDAKVRLGIHVQLIDIWVEYAIHEADAGALVGVLVRKLNVDLPKAAGEGGCSR